MPPLGGSWGHLRYSFAFSLPTGSIDYGATRLRRRRRQRRLCGSGGGSSRTKVISVWLVLFNSCASGCKLHELLFNCHIRRRRSHTFVKNYKKSYWSRPLISLAHSSQTVKECKAYTTPQLTMENNFYSTLYNKVLHNRRFRCVWHLQRDSSEDFEFHVDGKRSKSKGGGL